MERATVRPAVADSGFSIFEVHDSPEQLARTYPISAEVREPGIGAHIGQYKMRGVRFRSAELLDAFRARHPDLQVTVQT